MIWFVSPANPLPSQTKTGIFICDAAKHTGKLANPPVPITAWETLCHDLIPLLELESSSDLGHCGRENIRVSWAFVKIALLLNYFGQGAWLLSKEGQTLDGARTFFGIMPEWFLPFGIGIATLASRGQKR